MKHSYILILLLLLFGVLPTTAYGQPNIVLFICDDMTWSDAGCYGSNDAKTPNLDKLASQGMKFERCFTSTAMCAPTRQQLYTGLWPVRSGAYPNHSAVQAGTRSLGHHFEELGYRVALSGKKHYKPAVSYPFEFLGGNKQDDLNFSAIEQFITRKADQPYFLICATFQPHGPWTMGDRSAYDPAKLKLPDYLADTPETREALADYFAEVTHMDMLLGKVMAQLEATGQADNTILLFTSEQGNGLPFAKWTCYEAGLKTGLVVRWPGKVKADSTTDAMVQYVDIVPTLLDAVGGEPTAVDTGVKGAPNGGKGFDGTSFLPVLHGKSDQHRHYVFGVHTTRGIINGSKSYPIRSVRGKRYKLIVNLNHEEAFSNIAMSEPFWKSWVKAADAGDERAAKAVNRYKHRPEYELYDLQNDPQELNNLADKPALREARDRLEQKLKAWMAQQGDQGEATEMKVKAHRSVR